MRDTRALSFPIVYVPRSNVVVSISRFSNTRGIADHTAGAGAWIVLSTMADARFVNPPTTWVPPAKPRFSGKGSGAGARADVAPVPAAHPVAKTHGTSIRTSLVLAIMAYLMPSGT
jgi:hypothetical protein